MNLEDTAKNLVLDAGILMLDYELPSERILSATLGGSEYNITPTIREIQADGLKGKTKGFRRIVKMNAGLKTSLLGQSSDNMLLVIAGSGKSSPAIYSAVPAEFLGLGTASAESFTFDHAPVTGTIKFYVNGALQSWVAGTHYTLDGTALTIIGNDTIAENAEVTASYVWASGGAATHDRITPSMDIALSDYISNVALIAPVSGSDEVAVYIIKNVLNENGFTAKFEDEKELVIPCEFAAHWDPANITAPIAYVDHPKIA